MPGAHALLSPSSAKRWITCSRSARYTEGIPEEESEYSEEGTLAHDLAEWTLKRDLGLITESKFKDEFLRIRKSKHYYKGMPEDIAPYVDFVLTWYAEAKAEDPNAKIYLETQIDLSAWVPESFGTLDARITTKWTTRIIDLKFGQGVPVSAIENDQLKVYALGAMTAHDREYGNYPTKTKMAIVQPRIKEPSVWEIYTKDLQEYGYAVVKPAAKLAFAGGTEFVAGEHCQFCKIRATCKTLAAYNLETVDSKDWKEPNELTDEQISDVIQRAAIFRGWLSKVEKYALNQALTGKSWPGMKIVHGRSNRQYGDEAAIIKGLSDAGLDIEEVTTFSLVGITELKKLIGGGKKFKTLVEPYLTKESGAPTLVLDSDERPAIHSASDAREEFGDWDDDEITEL